MTYSHCLHMPSKHRRFAYFRANKALEAVLFPFPVEFLPVELRQAFKLFGFNVIITLHQPKSLGRLHMMRSVYELWH